MESRSSPLRSYIRVYSWLNNITSRHASNAEWDQIRCAEHKDLLEFVLSHHGKALDAVWFIVGDNCSTNKAIANLMKVPFIGCASHCFNLACEAFLDQISPITQKVHNVMIKLRTIKKSATLRKFTDLEPVVDNMTRWSSKHAMLSRYLQLKLHLHED